MTHDVVIIGGGTVGLYLASAFRAQRRTVAVVEGGVAEFVTGSSPVSPTHLGTTQGWMAGYGGTSRRWGGQLWPWERWETLGGAHRAGWPIDFDTEIEPFYRPVLERLGLSMQHERIHRGEAERESPEPPVEGFAIRSSTWMTRRERDFTTNRALSRFLVDVTVLHDAFATAIDSRANEHVIELLHDGARSKVVGRTVVIAAGTLGNAQLLSALGLPEAGDGFADHLSARVAEVEVEDRRRFADAFAQRWIRGVRASRRIVADRVTAEHRLPGYLHFENAVSPSSLFGQVAGVLRRDRGGIGAGAAAALESGDEGHQPLTSRFRALTFAAGSFARKQRPLDVSAPIHLRVDVEQVSPAPGSLRWGQGDRSDLVVDWHVDDHERDAIGFYAEQARTLLEGRFGVRRLHLLSSVKPHDTFHMLGGTVMGRSVDTDLAVRERPSMFVVGASTFPSGGVANPTLTALALGERLVRRLAE